MDLRIEGLSKTYENGTRALNNVSLTIPPGMFGLLGPNGAGKSTLMRILATLQEADAGSVFLATSSSGDSPGDGAIDVLHDKEAVRRRLGYLPQEFGVYPKVTAEDLLDHFAILKGITDRSERKRIVDALFEQTNLESARRKQLGGYSGGMRQRFGIAVALLGNPSLIIVDEPTAGLDPAERVRFLNLLAELGESAVVILSTHIVDDVSDLCSRMAIIDRGEIRLEGEPAATIAAVRGKIWVRTVTRPELSDMQRGFAVISTKLAGGKTLVRVFGETQPGPEFEPSTATLEDVYFAALRQGAPAAAAGTA
ncbi:MAG TPA: ABC transporter ATP-binding protein [Gemmatimonadaceae bacterium]|jgi:ABC-type multidrug transport system ATPase subunit|nr:ABC transporter ATP-binding protein [Gemmatimonadaceae bacterium]